MVASGTNMMLVDPPPFHSGSHNVASELRKRAAQNASETFSKVETPRGRPHPGPYDGFASGAGRGPTRGCRAVSRQFVTGSCLDGPVLGVEAWTHRGDAGRTASGGRAAGSGAQKPMTAHHRRFVQVVDWRWAGTTRPSPSTVSRG